MNMSMNTQRLTISLPNYLYDQLMALYGRGEVSRFISETVEKEIIADKLIRKNRPAEELLRLKKGLPKITRAQIFKAIAKGRA
jgi:hypothetical protein